MPKKFIENLTANVFPLLLQMGIHLEMGLRLATEYLHLILIETFIRAELQLGRAIAEVDVAHSIPDALAEVASLGTFKGRSSPRKEAIFRAKNRPLRPDDLR